MLFAIPTGRVRRTCSSSKCMEVTPPEENSMKRRVLQTLIVLLTTTLLLTTATAHEQPAVPVPSSLTQGYESVALTLAHYMYETHTNEADFDHQNSNIHTSIDEEDIKIALDSVSSDMSALHHLPHIRDAWTAPVKSALRIKNTPKAKAFNTTQVLNKINSLTIDPENGPPIFNYPQKVKLWKFSVVMGPGFDPDILSKHRRPHPPWADVNEVNGVNFLDLVLVGNIADGSRQLEVKKEDANRDRIIDYHDIILVASQISETNTTPKADIGSEPLSFSAQDVDDCISKIDDLLKDDTLKEDVKPKIGASVETTNLQRAKTALERLRAVLIAAASDVDGSGAVDFLDLVIVGNAYRNSSLQPRPDINSDNQVNLEDMKLVASVITDRSETAVARIQINQFRFTKLSVVDWINEAKKKQYTDLVAVLEVLKKAPKLTSEDVDRTDTADYRDLIVVGNVVKTGNKSANTDPDANRSGEVDVHDIVYVAAAVHNRISDRLANAQEAVANTDVSFSAADVQTWIDATSYTSVKNVLIDLKKALILRADVDGNSVVDFHDLIIVANAAKGTTVENTEPNVNGIGGVDIDDIIFVAKDLTVIEMKVLRSVSKAARPILFSPWDVDGWIQKAREKVPGHQNLDSVLHLLSYTTVEAGVYVDSDDDVDFEDLIIVGNAIKTDNTVANTRPDVNKEGTVDVTDLSYVAATIPTSTATLEVVRTALANTPAQFTAQDVDTWIKKLNRPGSEHIVSNLRLLKDALLPADVDGNGTVNVVDFIKVANAVKNPSNAPAGTNADGIGGVDIDDIIFMAKAMGDISTDALRAASIETGVIFTVADVDSWIGVAEARPDSTTIVEVLKKLRHAPVLAARDVNRDKKVDFKDIIIVGNAIISGTAAPNTYPDVDGNAVFDAYDIIYVVSTLPVAERTVAAATTALKSISPAFTVVHVDAWIIKATEFNRQDLADVLRHLKTARAAYVATGAPQAPALMQRAADVRAALDEARRLNADPATIATLEQLLATLIQAGTPKKTALLMNYPNPFNPETWIPYHLATPAKVSIAIYAADGKLVRTLDLGHLPAGRYQEKSSAAYWDGRNAQGEPVASGLYFYTFTAGEFTATQKMLIRK